MNTTTPTKITKNQLFALLAVKNGAQIVTFIARTDARLLKTGNTLGQVDKVSKVNGIVNFNYTNAVNNRREREALKAGEAPPEPFVAHPRKWGSRLDGLPFVAHNGKLYLEIKVERSLDHQYVQGSTVLSDEQVKPFLPKKKSNAEHQGVDKEIILRDYDMGNVEFITCGGTTYELVERLAA